MLYFLKLGGSLITNKHQAHTVRSETLDRLANELAAAKREQPDLRLLIGHGSGSFGHMPARQYHTRQGVQTASEWLGFAHVWAEARALNQLVVEALLRAGLPAISFAPSASVEAQDGQVLAWNLNPIQAALANSLVPLVYGDVVFDAQRGGTILSTEDLFCHLAPRLHPDRILLAGIEPGVWADFPACTRLIQEITPATLAQSSTGLRGSAAVDVTGGMQDKVIRMTRLVEVIQPAQIMIFSGEQPGQVQQACLGDCVGTVIHV